MDIAEVLECLSDGHQVFSVEAARGMCELFGVPFPEEAVMVWQGQADAFRLYGFLPVKDAPGAGVDDLAISYHIARCLGLGAPGCRFRGKGWQARANVEAIRGKLAEMGMLS